MRFGFLWRFLPRKAPSAVAGITSRVNITALPTDIPESGKGSADSANSRAAVIAPDITPEITPPSVSLTDAVPQTAELTYRAHRDSGIVTESGS